MTVHNTRDLLRMESTGTGPVSISVKKVLPGKGKRDMISVLRQIKRQGKGERQSPMPLCRRHQLLHNSICYASPIIVDPCPLFKRPPALIFTRYGSCFHLLPLLLFWKRCDGVCVYTYAVWGYFILRRFSVCLGGKADLPGGACRCPAGSRTGEDCMG